MGFTKEDTKAVKGTAVCLMLYCSLFGMEGGAPFRSLASFGGTALAAYIGQFGRIYISVFLFLCGYELCLLSLRSDDVKKTALNGIWRSYKVFWKVFFLLLPVFAYIYRYKRSLLLKDIIYNFLGLNFSFNTEWRFLVPLAMLLILFPSVKRFLERERADIFTDLLLLFAYSTVYNYIVPQIIALPVLGNLRTSVFWDHINRTLGIFPAFFLGCLFAEYGILDAVKCRFAGKVMWCIPALVGMAAVFCLSLCSNGYDFVYGAVWIICAAVFLPFRILKLPEQFFEKLGEEAAYIWLIHTFFCTCCQKLIYAPRYSFLIFLLLLAVSFCAAKLIKLFWTVMDKLFSKKPLGRSIQ